MLRIKDLTDTGILKARNTHGYINVRDEDGREMCFSCGPAYVTRMWGDREVLEIIPGLAESSGDGLLHTTITLVVNKQ